MKLDPAALPSEVVNRLLGREAWARDKLAAHAGRVFTVSVGPASTAFRISADGLLEHAARDSPVDLRITLSPFNVPAFLADPRLWNQFVVEEGDADLGGALKNVAQTLPWFVEQAFAQVLGPIAGQRAADAGRRLLSFPAYAADRVATSVGRYARDEAQLLARGDELREMTTQTADLSARIDALNARVSALAARISGGRPALLR